MMTKPDRPGEQRPPAGATEKTAYSTFPLVTPHGPHDKSSYHGKPEDWRRVAPKRTFGGRTT